MNENGLVHVLFNYYVQGSREFEGKVKQFYIFAFYVNQTHITFDVLFMLRSAIILFIYFIFLLTELSRISGFLYYLIKLITYPSYSISCSDSAICFTDNKEIHIRK